MFIHENIKSWLDREIMQSGEPQYFLWCVDRALNEIRTEHGWYKAGDFPPLLNLTTQIDRAGNTRVYAMLSGQHYNISAKLADAMLEAGLAQNKPYPVRSV